MRLLYTCIFALICLPALAQPAGVTRVLRTIDFEERRLGNHEELPMHWTRIEGPGMPHYLAGRLTDDRARSGKYSFRMDLNGGSLAYRYEPGAIKVQQGAHYRIETFVQTTALTHARARLIAYLLDVDGRPIGRSMALSEPYTAATPDDPWHALQVEVSVDDLAAASLVVELGVYQPGLLKPGATTMPADPADWPQDIRGSAWFDDVSIAQIPRVTITTQAPGNIFRRSETAALQVRVSDPFIEDLAAQLVVQDATGKQVYQRTGALEVSTAEARTPGEKKARLVLPKLAPGWYEAAIETSSQGQALGHHTLRFIVLADDASSVGADDRFGIIATVLPFEAWEKLPEILPMLGAGRVKLAVWSKAGDIEQMDPAAFDNLLVRLAALHITPTAALLDLPPSVSGKIKSDSWASLVAARPEDWQPQLSELVARHAAHLDRWQLGADGSDAFATQPPMREAYAKVLAQFTSLVHNPDLAMPWPAWYELDGKMPATVALAVPASVLPSQLPLYIQDINRRQSSGPTTAPSAAHHLSLTLQMLDRAQYGRQVQLRDTAQRVIVALASGSERIDFPLPFESVRENDQLVTQPDEMFIIVRTLISTLGGAAFRGKVPIAEGIEAYLFDRNGQGIIALWDRGPTVGVKQLALRLGQRPMQVDLWGNVTPLMRSAGSADGEVRLAIGPTPVFLIDVDGALAQLRAGIGFDQPLIESSFQAHGRKIHFTNPYKQTISGTLRLRAPSGWTITPPTIAFNVNPGETIEKDVTIAFPYNSVAGIKTVEAQFNLQGEQNMTITAPLTLTLGLSDVGMQSFAIRDGKGGVIVQQMITNYGDKPIDYDAFAMLPGQARQERLVMALPPGKTTIKRYRFTGPNLDFKALVRVGLKQQEGTRVLNDQVEIQ